MSSNSTGAGGSREGSPGLATGPYWALPGISSPVEAPDEDWLLRGIFQSANHLNQYCQGGGRRASVLFKMLIWSPSQDLLGQNPIRFCIGGPQESAFSINGPGDFGTESRLFFKGSL